MAAIHEKLELILINLDEFRQERRVNPYSGLDHKQLERGILDFEMAFMAHQKGVPKAAKSLGVTEAKVRRASATLAEEGFRALVPKS